VRAVLDAYRIDAVVTLGGNGTLKYSHHLSTLGVRVVAVPKTMDNDVPGTDYCLGFSTAITRSVDAINALRTTCASHERVGVIELFGRRSGETALVAGLLSGADRIALTESPIEPDVLADLLAADRAASPDHHAMVVVSEGASFRSEPGSADVQRSNTARDPTGIGTRFARHLERRTGIGTVVQELAYLMRAGAPDAVDRMVGLCFGKLAVDLLERGESGRLVAVRRGSYTHVPIDAVTAESRSVALHRYDASTYRARVDQIDAAPMFLAGDV
jgi:ATP-dependent phosphofructokinase / diphosphate-dependent phosphofructokinase